MFDVKQFLYLLFDFLNLLFDFYIWYLIFIFNIWFLYLIFDIFFGVWFFIFDIWFLHLIFDVVWYFYIGYRYLYLSFGISVVDKFMSSSLIVVTRSCVLSNLKVWTEVNDEWCHGQSEWNSIWRAHLASTACTTQSFWLVLSSVWPIWLGLFHSFAFLTHFKVIPAPAVRSGQPCSAVKIKY